MSGCAGCLAAPGNERRDPLGGVPRQDRVARAEEADALAGDGQQFGQRQRQHSRAVALGRRRQAASGNPSTARGRPRARACGRLPIPFSRTKRCSSRAERRQSIEDAASPVMKGRNCQKVSPRPLMRRPCQPASTVVGDAARLDQQVGQAVGDALRLGQRRPRVEGGPIHRPCLSDPLLQFGDHVADGHAVGAGGEAERHAVLQHRLGERRPRRRATGA